MDITIARIQRIESAGVRKAYVDILIDHAILIKGIAIIEGKKGLFVSYPKQQGKDGHWYNTVQPITLLADDQLSKAILQAYTEPGEDTGGADE